MRSLLGWILLSGVAAAVEMPPVEDAIPAPVKALAAPVPVAFQGGLKQAVSAASDEVQRSVLQGLNHLHGGWEFEAARHFAVALRADPECLMAHWGMVMATLVPSPETGTARNAAEGRLLALVDQGKGTKLERGYAYGLIKYLQEGPAAATSAFGKVAAEFPQDLQAPMLAALFGRSGYDEIGQAKPDQERSEAALLKLMEAHPDSFLPLNALLVVRAEGGDLAPSLELARRLDQMMPEYPPFQHILGHYEWRCGNFRPAAATFDRAAARYDAWLKANDATLADCAGRTKAECYRVVALASAGDFDEAMAAAGRLAATPLPTKRDFSSGSRILLWEAKTLQARLLLARGGKGCAAKAMATLPTPASLKSTHGQCLAYWWIDALRLVLETQRLAEAGDLTEARKVQDAITFHGDKMAKAQPLAAELGERSAWNRAFKALEMLAFETRAKMALAGPANLHGIASNWLRAAADSQQPAVMLYPPVLPVPQLARLGLHQLGTGKPDAALETFQDALRRYPNDLTTLDGLARAHEALKQPAAAAATRKLILQIRTP